MKKEPAMKGSWIAIEGARGERFEGYLSKPAQGSGPGLVLCQEIFGVTEDMRRMADLFAEEGYVVIVPDLFWRFEPHLELAHDKSGLARALELSSRFDASLAQRDIAAAAQALRQESACKGKIGVLGHCLGGRLAVMAAASGDFACAVSYYGVGIDKVLGGLPPIEVPTVLHFAGEDRFVPQAAVAAIRDRLEGREGIEIYVYPEVGHAFANPARQSYNKQASDMAHTRTIALLRRVLGPNYDLSALWEAHRACEFITRDAKATMLTMVDAPYVNHIPTLTGGYGHDYLQHFYEHHFIPKSPKDIRNIPISRTVGADRVVNEVLLCFTHDCEIDWMLPGVPPTGKYVEVALVGIITFRGDKLMHEHIYWDQASVLVQIGLLDPTGLPVAGIEAAKKVLDPSLPSNTMLKNWKGGHHA
jgi:carboxymethylenebutenolidase